MLKIKLLNEQVTLNNFRFVETKEYIPNLPFVLKVQIQASETLQRLIPGTSAKLNAIFQKRDGTSLTKACSMIFNPDDRSMWQVSISKIESNDIVGSNVQFNLDFTGDSTTSDLADATDLRSGMAYSILAKITFDGEC
jgi:hypothetical protein